jgi:hypothetical protein
MTEESTVSYSRRSAEVDITETLNEEMVHNDFTIGTEITDLLGIYHHPAPLYLNYVGQQHNQVYRRSR